MFMAWAGTNQELLDKTIKLEHNISLSNISCLDALIYRTRTTLFRQLSTENPLISNPIFHAHSEHPTAFKKSYRIA